MAFFPGAGAGAGFAKQLNLDVGGGFGAGAGAGIPLGYAGGSAPVGGVPPVAGPGVGWGGVPYVPVTPLGALGGIKGDLLVPIVAVGVAIFLLLIIVLAVKAALTWKLSLLSGLASKKFRRDTAAAGGPPEEDQLNHLANMVLSAIQSQACAQNMICRIGEFTRAQQGLPSLLRIVEAVVPTSVQEPLQILRSSAEGSFNCDDKYKCSTNSTSPLPPSSSKKPVPDTQSNSIQ